MSLFYHKQNQKLTNISIEITCQNSISQNSAPKHYPFNPNQKISTGATYSKQCIVIISLVFIYSIQLAILIPQA